jgi:predicted kinase
MNKELIILVGPPGAGKSTLSVDLVHQGFQYINQDEQGRSQHLTNFLGDIYNNKNVVVDRLNFNKEQRERYLKPAREAGYKTKIIVLQTSRFLCFERMGQREDHPTIKDLKSAKSAMNTFLKYYERPTQDEADELVFIRRNTNSNDQRDLDNRKKCVVIDLDGTLANCDHRLHFVKNKPKDWNSFYKGIENDKVNRWCQTLIESLHDSGISIVYASGRPQDYYEITYNWLLKNDLDFGPLFMREKGDYRQDYFAKETILDFSIEPAYNPILFIDDRQQVIDLWRRRGYTALQCAKGDF